MSILLYAALPTTRSRVRPSNLENNPTTLLVMLAVFFSFRSFYVSLMSVSSSAPFPEFFRRFTLTFMILSQPSSLVISQSTSVKVSGD